MRIGLSILAASAAAFSAAPAEASIYVFGGSVTSSSIAGVSIGDSVIWRVTVGNESSAGSGSWYADVDSQITAGTFSSTVRTFADRSFLYGSGYGFGNGMPSSADLVVWQSSSVVGYTGPRPGNIPAFTTGTISTQAGVIQFSGGGLLDVPEPATWALMIAGFGLTGAAIRRRRPIAA